MLKSHLWVSLGPCFKISASKKFFTHVGGEIVLHVCVIVWILTESLLERGQPSVYRKYLLAVV